MGALEVRTGGDLWLGLTPQLRTKGRTYAAVAFVGVEAPKLLPLKAGDVLVVNAGDRTLASGGTSPQALRVFVDRGVEVWSESNLTRRLWPQSVGSPSWARRTPRRTPTTCGKRSSSPVTQRLDDNSRGFVKGLVEVSERVDKQFLHHAERVYRHPKGRVGDDSNPPGPFADLPTRLWLVEVEDYQPTAAEERRADREIKALPVTRGWRYDDVYWDKDSNVAPRDTVIKVQRGWLSPPGRVMQLSDGSALSGGRSTAVACWPSTSGTGASESRASISPRQSRRNGTRRGRSPSPTRSVIRRVMQLWVS